MLLPLLLLALLGKRNERDLLFVGNWIGYYLPGGELPGRVGSLLPDVVVVVVDEDLKDGYAEFAYVPWEQQPDDFLISVLWTEKGKEEGVGGDGGDGWGGRRFDGNRLGALSCCSDRRLHRRCKRYSCLTQKKIIECRYCFRLMLSAQRRYRCCYWKE